MVAPEIRNWRRYGTTIEVGRSQPETKTQRIFARLGFQTICMLVGAIYIHWFFTCIENKHIYIGMIMVALTLLGFHGDFLVATTWWIFWCVNWPWYTACIFWWFFSRNNPWHLDIEMIMVALRLHGLEAGTEPERSGSGAGTKRIRWFQRFFTVFHGFLACRFAPASLPLHSRFTPAFFFSCFLTFFAVFPVFFYLDFWFFWLFGCFYVFFPGIVSFFLKG